MKYMKHPLHPAATSTWPAALLPLSLLLPLEADSSVGEKDERADEMAELRLLLLLLSSSSPSS
jgi:hypothetical protein